MTSRNLKTSPIFIGIMALGAGLAVAWLVVLTISVFASPDGIINHPSGEAVYLGGEACVVNARPQVSHQQFVEMTNWCVQRHAEEF